MKKPLLLLPFLLIGQAFAQPVKIGELNSYKVFPAFLEPYKKGWELAVEEVNAAGGVLGRMIQPVVVDIDVLSPEGCQASIRKLVLARVSRPTMRCAR